MKLLSSHRQFNKPRLVYFTRLDDLILCVRPRV